MSSNKCYMEIPDVELGDKVRWYGYRGRGREYTVIRINRQTEFIDCVNGTEEISNHVHFFGPVLKEVNMKVGDIVKCIKDRPHFTVGKKYEVLHQRKDYWMTLENDEANMHEVGSRDSMYFSAAPKTGWEQMQEIHTCRFVDNGFSKARWCAVEGCKKEET